MKATSTTRKATTIIITSANNVNSGAVKEVVTCSLNSASTQIGLFALSMAATLVGKSVTSLLEGVLVLGRYAA